MTWRAGELGLHLNRMHASSLCNPPVDVIFKSLVVTKILLSFEILVTSDGGNKNTVCYCLQYILELG